MDTLPPELLSIIVLMVAETIKCGGMLRTVCKEWKDIIDRTYDKPMMISNRWITTITAAEWASNNGCNLNEICLWAIKGGYIEVLKWVRSNGIPWPNKYTCETAARYGHLEILQYAHSDGLAWSELWICVHASKNGHLHILKWLDSIGYIRYKEWACEWAAEYGHVHILKWYYKEYGELDGPRLHMEAFKNNQIEVLNWLHDMKIYMDCEES
jgi:hypothetical protein